MVSLKNHKLSLLEMHGAFVLLLFENFKFKVKYNIREQNKHWNAEENQ